MNQVEILKGEYILAVVPQHCAGSGWANSIVNVYIGSANREYRNVILQYQELSPEMKVLFNIGATVCSELVKAI